MKYRGGEIIDSYEEAKVKHMPAFEVHDFLQAIKPTQDEAEILRHWTEHFRATGWPYIVTENKDHIKTLWSRKVA